MLTVGSTFFNARDSGAGARRVCHGADLITATAISAYQALIDLGRSDWVCRCGGCIDRQTAGANGRPLLPDVQRALRTRDEADYLPRS